MRVGITATKANELDDGATLQQPAALPVLPAMQLPANGNGSTPVHYATDQNINVNPPVIALPAIPDDVLSLEQPTPANGSATPVHYATDQNINVNPPVTTPPDQSTNTNDILQMILPNNCANCNGDTITTNQAPATDQQPAGSFSFDFGSVGDWIKANTWTALLIGGAIIYLITNKKK